MEENKFSLTEVQTFFKQTNAFLLSAIKHGAIIEGFALAAEIGAMVASGKVDQATLTAALNSFAQLNESFATAFSEAQAA